MGFAHRTDLPNHFNFATATGYISGGELEGLIRRTIEEEAFACPQLIDARRATLVFTSTEACWLAFTLRRLAKTHQPGPIGIVVSTSANIGMVHMLRRLVSETCRIEAFLDLTEAQRWLEVQNGEVA